MYSRVRPFRAACLLLIGTLCAADVPATFAQNLFEQYRPRDPQSEESKGELPKPPEPATGSDQVLVAELKELVFVDNPAAISPEALEPTGLGIRVEGGFQLVGSEGFRQVVEPYLGGPVTMRRLNEMSRAIVLFYRSQNLPVVDVRVPEQDITSGVVQVIITESRVGKVRVTTNGYFDPCDLACRTCIQPGMPIYESLLVEDLRYFNLNPFRNVDLELVPGDDYGYTDVVYKVDDRAPWMFYTGYEDTGNESTNLERTIYGAHWGNVFGRDDSFGYQYTASPNFRDLEAHTAAYTIPLRSRDYLVYYGSYATIHPMIGPDFDSDGFAWQASTRYYHEVFPGRCCPHECLERNLIFGFDFRRTNSTLIFGQNVVFDEVADIAQLMVGYQSIFRDECGGYRNWGAELYVGPDWGFSPHNNDRDFNALRPGATSDYLFARGYFERFRHLTSTFDGFLRVTGQVSEGNLLASEQLGLGGYNTVRGYDMRLVNGDSGLVLNAELRTRPYCSNVGCCQQDIVLLTFFDYGAAWNHDLLVGEPDGRELASVGCGFRYSLGRHLSARFDYGWQLIDDDIPANFKDSRAHVGVVATF